MLVLHLYVQKHNIGTRNIAFLPSTPPKAVTTVQHPCQLETLAETVLFENCLFGMVSKNMCQVGEQQMVLDHFFFFILKRQTQIEKNGYGDDNLNSTPSCRLSYLIVEVAMVVEEITGIINEI